MRFLKLEQVDINGYLRYPVWINFDQVMTIQKREIERNGKEYVYSLLDMKDNRSIYVVGSPEELMETLKDL